MKLNFKNVFLSVGMFVFVFAMFGLVSVSKADAQTCTADASGLWSAAATWNDTDCATYPAGGDTATIPTGITVTITGAGAAATTLTLSGTSVLTISDSSALDISGVTTIGAGSTLNTGGGAVSPTGGLELSGTLNIGAGVFNSAGGATHIYSTGILTFLDTAGAKTFAAVTVDASGVYNESVAVATSTLASLTNAGTVTLKTGGHTLGGITNTGTFNYAGGTTLSTLTASTLGTINYNGAAGQAVQVIPYKNLGLSGGGTKTLAVGTAIAGTLAIASGTTVDLTGNSTANALTIGGTTMRPGTWGSSGSTSANNKNAAFTNDSYYVTVATGPHVTPPATPIITYPYVAPVDTTTPTTTTTEVTTTTTTTTEPAGGCSAGNLFNTQTGNACVNNPAVPEGCGGGKLFSPVTGVACPVSTSTTVTTTTTTTTYNLGTVTLKNGSKGEAVKELQRFLNAKLSLGLVIDGKLGPKTIAVIKKWQKDNGLVSDGLVGAKTKAMMNK